MQDCEEDSVRFTAENAKACLEWLIDQGVNFDQENADNGETRYHLTREGGHSHRRIFMQLMPQVNQFKPP